MPMSKEEYEERQKIYQYHEGLRDGVRRFAWWKDGEQQVGTCGTTLKEALAKIAEAENEKYGALAARYTEVK
jgi:phage-related minor tail protein